MSGNIKYSLYDQLLVERLVNIGESSVVLPPDIVGEGDTDLSDMSNLSSRYQRTAKVLKRYRDGIEDGKAARFGNIGEQIAQAVLSGRASNVYYDQNALFSDVRGQQGTYYSVKGIKSTGSTAPSLANQKIDVEKIDKLLNQEQLEEIKVGVFIITNSDEGLFCKWTSPITYKKGDLDLIKATLAKRTTKAGKLKDVPQWALRATERSPSSSEPGINFTDFVRLSEYAGHSPAATIKTKKIKLPGAVDSFDLPDERATVAELRGLLRSIMVADLDDAKMTQIQTNLQAIKSILDSEG